MNIGYIGIVINIKSVEILKTKYSLGDIIDFKVVELDKNKKRYVLDIEQNKIDDDNSSMLVNNLNVCEKSFYPQSYLKMVNIQDCWKFFICSDFNKLTANFEKFLYSFVERYALLARLFTILLIVKSKNIINPCF